MKNEITIQARITGHYRYGRQADVIAYSWRDAVRQTDVIARLTPGMTESLLRATGAKNPADAVGRPVGVVLERNALGLKFVRFTRPRFNWLARLRGIPQPFLVSAQFVAETATLNGLI